MCVPAAYGKNPSGPKAKPGSLGYRMEQGQRLAASTASGGTNGSTILAGTPRNSGVDALRKITGLAV